MSRTSKPVPDQLGIEKDLVSPVPGLPSAPSVDEVPDVFEMPTPPSYHVCAKVRRVEVAPFVFVDDFAEAEPPSLSDTEDECRKQV